MNFGFLGGARWLARRSHLLLAMHLLMLHTLAFGGWRVPAVRLLWVAALGLFLLWQPFIAGERRIGPRQGALLLGAVLLSTLALGPWLLLVWCGVLAAAIGGRSFRLERTVEGRGYLLAFGYLIAVVVLGVVPEIAPQLQLDDALRSVLAAFMPLALPLLLFFPAHPAPARSAGAFDLFYGVLVFLVLAVFVLGSLAYMLVSGASYIESLFKTSMTCAGAIFLMAWAWNPRTDFSGLGASISRYLLSLGMPLEQWLVLLAEESERHADPAGFLEAAMTRLATMSWIAGASWQVDGQAGRYGVETGFVHDCQLQDARLTAHFHHRPSPAMRWHVEWLLRLAFEFYLVKRQGEQLRRMGYVQAIYETGARVTHDVKNLLQSLQVLCYAASRPGDPAEVAGLLARQLPQIADRLQATLDKLQSPQIEVAEMTDAGVWWSRLRARYAHVAVDWGDPPPAGEDIPGALFDRVAENLLQNALAKRQREAGLGIAVVCAGRELQVVDNGSAVTEGVASSLFAEPVDSEDGFGIGLYHAARQAGSLGYRLDLAENRAGRVAFRLAPAP